MSTPEPHAPGTLQSFKRGHVGHVVFNNPRKFNAMSYDMWAALPQVMQDFVDDVDVRVIVLSGAGDKAFVSGADISQFDTMRTGDANIVYSQASEAGYAAVLDCPKPTVAQIQGICMGGGLGLALNCDVRICASNAKFRMPAGRLGLGYAFDGVKRFTEVVGVSHTADLFFSARIFDAQDALAMGLVKQVVAPEALSATVDDYTRTVCENAPLTLAAAKRALLELRKNPEQRDMALVQAMVSACFASQDYQEGRQAFAAKRAPVFNGH
ncbi:enoyl-CoA hydratase [Limnohabitans sp.]|uniref:enoyl-CoA hydratase n=1 Tax=Limnohabitans sp. TaxID=1907725 RepID=UPI0038BB5499